MALLVCGIASAWARKQTGKEADTLDVGVLNAKALRVPIVAYPRAARKAGVSGIVKVRVLTNRAGDVVQPKSRPGLLRSAALRSARDALLPPVKDECGSYRYLAGIRV